MFWKPVVHVQNDLVTLYVCAFKICLYTCKSYSNSLPRHTLDIFRPKKRRMSCEPYPTDIKAAHIAPALAPENRFI